MFKLAYSLRILNLPVGYDSRVEMRFTLSLRAKIEYEGIQFTCFIRRFKHYGF
jgi:hypothetical protein